MSDLEKEVFQLDESHHLRIDKDADGTKAGLYDFMLEAVPLMNTNNPAYKQIQILLCNQEVKD